MQDEDGLEIPAGNGGGKVPPHHLEAERAVLGAVLVQNQAIHGVIELGLNPQDFYREHHQKIFEILMNLTERGEPLDLVTLTTSLKDRGWFDSVGGTAALTQLMDVSFKAPNVLHYAKIVRDRAVVRRMINTAADIASEGMEGVEDVEAYVDEAERKIFEVLDQKQMSSFSSMNDILLKNMETIEHLAARKQVVTGLATGFEKFDRITSGLQGGQVIIIAGRPAMGKSSLAVSAAQNAAVNHGAVVALFSLEMSKEELAFRMMSSAARIDAKRLKVGRLLDRDWAKLAQAADQLSKSKVYIDDSGILTVLDMRARCRRLFSMEKRLDLVVVDYLQLMRGSKSSRGESNREREISEISRQLKGLAKELKVPIVVLSQLNRNLENRPNKRPMLSDLRESGSIEQDADIVCFVYRDEVYNPETEDKGVAELIIAKHRAGETDTVRLAWLKEYTLFANLAEDAPGAPLPAIKPKRGGSDLSQ